MTRSPLTGSVVGGTLRTVSSSPPIAPLARTRRTASSRPTRCAGATPTRPFHQHLPGCARMHQRQIQDIPGRSATGPDLTDPPSATPASLPGCDRSNDVTVDADTRAAPAGRRHLQTARAHAEAVACVFCDVVTRGHGDRLGTRALRSGTFTVRPTRRSAGGSPGDLRIVVDAKGRAPPTSWAVPTADRLRDRCRGGRCRPARGALPGSPSTPIAGAPAEPRSSSTVRNQKAG
jgi:hypothetical protein